MNAGRVALLRGPRVPHVGPPYSDSSGATVLTRDISVVPGMHGFVERYYTVLTSSLEAIPTAWLCIVYAPSTLTSSSSVNGNTGLTPIEIVYMYTPRTSLPRCSNAQRETRWERGAHALIPPAARGETPLLSMCGKVGRCGNQNDGTSTQS